MMRLAVTTLIATLAFCPAIRATESDSPAAATESAAATSSPEVAAPKQPGQDGPAATTAASEPSAVLTQAKETPKTTSENSVPTEPAAVTSASPRLYVREGGLLLTIDLLKDSVVPVAAKDEKALDAPIALQVFFQNPAGLSNTDEALERLQKLARTSGPPILVTNAQYTSSTRLTLFIRHDADPQDVQRIVDVFQQEPAIDVHVAAEPGFELWVLKKDWSKSPAWEEIQTDVQNATKDSPSSDARTLIPANMSELFFPSEVTVMYTPEHAVALRGWLESRQLLEKVIPQSMEGDFTQPTVVSSNDDLSISMPAPESERFVERSYQWRNQLDWSGDPFRVRRSLFLTETWKGDSPSQSEVGNSTLQLDIPEGFVGFADAFVPGRWMNQNGMTSIPETDPEDRRVLLVVARKRVGERSDPAKEVVSPSLRLPDQVRPTKVGFPMFGMGGGVSAEMGPAWSNAQSRSRGGNSPTGATRQAPAYMAGSASPVPAFGGFAPTTRGRRSPFAERKADNEEIKVFSLQNADAASIAELLTQILGDPRVRFVADPRTNQILASGAAETLAKAEALILRLDENNNSTNRDGAPSENASQKDRQSSSTGDINSLRVKYAALESDSRRIAQEIKDQGIAPNGDDARAKVMTNKLSQTVAAAFEARQALLAAELRQMRAKIQDSEQSLTLRSRIQGEIVNRRVEDLLNPELQWDATESPIGSPASDTSPAPSDHQANLYQLLSEDLKVLTAHKSQLLQKFGPKHSDVEDVEIKIAGLNNKLQKELQVELGRLDGLWEQPQPRSDSNLVIHDGVAAQFIRKDLTGLWTLSFHEERGKKVLLFSSTDIKLGEMKADWNEQELTMVGLGPNGLYRDQWRRTALPIPDEWVAAIEDAKKKHATAAKKTETPDTATTPPSYKEDPNQIVSTTTTTETLLVKLLRKRIPDLLIQPAPDGKSFTIRMTRAQDKEANRITRESNLITMLKGLWTPSPVSGRVVIHEDVAARFVDGKIATLWSISAEQNGGESLITFTPLEKGASILRTKFNSKALTFVQAVDGGLERTQWTKDDALPPDEWIQAMKEEAKKRGINEIDAGPDATSPFSEQASTMAPSDFVERARTLRERLQSDAPADAKAPAQAAYDALRLEFETKVEIAKAELSSAKAQREVLSGKLESAEAMYRSARAPHTDVQTAQAELEQVKASLDKASLTMKFYEEIRPLAFPENPLRGQESAARSTQTAAPADGRLNSPSDFVARAQELRAAIADEDARLADYLRHAEPGQESRERAQRGLQLKSRYKALHLELTSRIDTAVAELRRAQADLNAAKLEADQTRKLAEKNVISKSEVELKNATLDKAAADVAGKESALKLYEDIRNLAFPEDATDSPETTGDATPSSPLEAAGEEHGLDPEGEAGESKSPSDSAKTLDSKSTPPPNDASTSPAPANEAQPAEPKDSDASQAAAAREENVAP